MYSIVARCTAALLVLVLMLSPGQAQNLGPHYTDPDSLPKGAPKALYLMIQNANYFKNNEYFGEIIPGYTLPGVELSPRLHYAPSATTAVELGVQAQYVFGDDLGVRTAPLFRVQWQAQPWLRLVMGSLFSHSAHRLSEAMLNPELPLHTPRETGLQLRIDTRHLRADAWVSWDQFIWFRAPKNERLWAGFSGSLKWDDLGLHIPLMATANHSGGQIDLTYQPATTELNVASGLELHLRAGQWFDRIELGSLLLGYATDAPQNYDYFGPQRLAATGRSLHIDGQRYQAYNELPRALPLVFDHGYGSLSRLMWHRGPWQSALEYWYGYNYYSPRGDYIYHSRSPFTGAVQSARSFVRWHGAYEKRFDPNLRLAIALDAIYLLQEKKTDLAMGLYLFFDHRSLLHRSQL